MWAAIIVGVLGVLGLVCCGGIVYFGLTQGGAAFIAPLNGVPEVTQKVGTVETASFNFGESLERGQDRPQHIVLDIQGTTGSAKVLLKPGSEGGLDALYFIEPNGDLTEVDLSGAGSPPPLPADDDSQPDDAEPLDPLDAELNAIESELGTSP